MDIGDGSVVNVDDMECVGVVLGVEVGRMMDDEVGGRQPSTL